MIRSDEQRRTTGGWRIDPGEYVAARRPLLGRPPPRGPRPRLVVSACRLEHAARAFGATRSIPAGSRPRRLVVRAEQLGERPAAHDRLGPLGNDVRARAGLVVAALDQQPLRLGARPRSAGARSRRAASRRAGRRRRGRGRAPPARRRGRPARSAAVPDDHAAVAERALEVVVAEPVVLDLDRQALGGGVERRALGHRPRAHHAVDLEAHVVVMGGRLMLLHHEHPGAHAADRELLVALDASTGSAATPVPRNASSSRTASGAPSACSSPVGRTHPRTPSSRAFATTASASDRLDHPAHGLRCRGRASVAPGDQVPGPAQLRASGPSASSPPCCMTAGLALGRAAARSAPVILRITAARGTRRRPARRRTVPARAADVSTTIPSKMSLCSSASTCSSMPTSCPSEVITSTPSSTSRYDSAARSPPRSRRYRSIRRAASGSGWPTASGSAWPSRRGGVGLGVSVPVADGEGVGVGVADAPGVAESPGVGLAVGVFAAAGSGVGVAFG